MSTAIEWNNLTDNPIVAKGGGWWCRKISPACANCYAEMINASSFYGGNRRKYVGAPPELSQDPDLGWAFDELGEVAA